MKIVLEHDLIKREYFIVLREDDDDFVKYISSSNDEAKANYEYYRILGIYRKYGGIPIIIKEDTI